MKHCLLCLIYYIHGEDTSEYKVTSPKGMISVFLRKPKLKPRGLHSHPFHVTIIVDMQYVQKTKLDMKQA